MLYIRVDEKSYNVLSIARIVLYRKLLVAV